MSCGTSPTSARRGSWWRVGFLVLASFGLDLPVGADLITVPGDFSSIQGALDAAGPGDTIEVGSGIYFEKLVVPASGTLAEPLVLRAAPGASPILDGTGVVGSNMVLIDTKSYVQIVGFEIRNNLSVNDGSGIRVVGSGAGIEIRENVIHDMRGEHAMGITVYGTDPVPISGLVVQGNQIYDCEPASSEALTLNGNVVDFAVVDNLVRDVNNIGIDFIGGETDIQPDPTLVARQGVVRGNTVLRANSIYDGGYAGGIYVDGGRDIVIENNRVAESDLGIEVGAENTGLVTEGVVVRNNLIHHNEKAGLVFGGYSSTVGRANDNRFTGNTLFANNTVGKSGTGTHFPGGGIGEIWVQFAEDNLIAGNLVVAGPENVLIGSFDPGSSVGNTFDHNLYFTTEDPEGSVFGLNGVEYLGLANWVVGSGQDSHSLGVDPQLVDPLGGDYHLLATSPAVDAGDPGFVAAAGEVDLDGEARVQDGRIDIGADEAGSPLFRDGFESGDTTGWGS